MNSKRNAGSTMVAAVVFTSIVAVVVGVAVTSTAHVARNTQRSKLRDGAVATGDTYLEWAFAQWRAACRLQPNRNLPTSEITINEPPAGLLTEPLGFSIVPGSYQVTAVDPMLKPMGANNGPKPGKGQDAGESSYHYLASVDVTVPAMAKPDITVKLRRVFEKHLESPWRYAIFYNDMLEIHPSPKFTVDGWVHTNGDLYATPDGGNLLEFLDRVTYGSTYKQGYAEGNYVWRGKPSNGPAPTYSDDLPPARDIRKDPFGITPEQFDTSDTNKNNDGYRELIERPESGSDLLAGPDGENPRFYSKAGLKILVDGNNKVTIKDSADRTVVASGAPNATTVVNPTMYNEVISSITTNQSIQDNREAASVRLVTVNVGAIETAKIAGWNGVVYVSDTSASQTGGSPKRGVRVRNGATLPTGGLTIVSDNPVYIQGDYNTSANRQPSAVIGDAVMILSNAWTDSGSAQSLANRKASNTTVNTAILGGVVPTITTVNNNTAYSGGVENFPRFLEEWAGKTFTYNGSMVQLFQSNQATGRWGKSNVYGAPGRKWAFDPMFRENPPPGTFFITTYVKQRWFVAQ